MIIGLKSHIRDFFLYHGNGLGLLRGLGGPCMGPEPERMNLKEKLYEIEQDVYQKWDK